MKKILIKSIIGVSALAATVTFSVASNNRECNKADSLIKEEISSATRLSAEETTAEETTAEETTAEETTAEETTAEETTAEETTAEETTAEETTAEETTAEETTAEETTKAPVQPGSVTAVTEPVTEAPTIIEPYRPIIEAPVEVPEVETSKPLDEALIYLEDNFYVSPEFTQEIKMFSEETDLSVLPKNVACGDSPEDFSQFVDKCNSVCLYIANGKVYGLFFNS